MRSSHAQPGESVDKTALVTSVIGVLAHAGMMVLDAMLIGTSVDLVTTSDQQGAVVLATALTGLVMLHLLVVAWVGRHVVDFVEIARDTRLPTFTRRTRVRAAARRAGAALLVTGALAPAAALILALVPLISPATIPLAGLQ